jgi:fatty-acyl-CoA synthase
VNVSASELVAYAKQHIVERAAAPVEVILVDEIPKTGIDKVFKPALRFDAIKRTYEGVIADHPDIRVDAVIEVSNDPSAGVMASVLLRGDKSVEQEALVSSALSHFTTQFSVQWASEQ